MDIERIMATGESNFLADLEGLGEDSDEDVEEEERERKPPVGGLAVKTEDLDALDSDADDFDEDGQQKPAAKMEIDRDVPDFERLLSKIKGDTLDSVANLRKTKRYKDHLARVEANMLRPGAAISGPLESDPEYQLIVSSNKLVQDIDDEIETVHRFVVEMYAKKFPELESLVPQKMDYIHTVMRIGNETDLTLVDLSDLLPTAAVMVVSVTASSTSGKPLPPDALEETLRGCREVLELFQDRQKILRYVESRMSVIAPNLVAVVGSSIASQLMGLAGGLMALSRIPANSIQLIGQEKKSLQGLTGPGQVYHAGVVLACDLAQSAPPGLRLKAVRVISGKVALAARMDAYQQSQSGEGGYQLRADIEEKIEKWQEPPKGPEKKPLPVPDEGYKKKRGGKRVRKFKERFAMTDMRKEANRRKFGDITMGEYGDEAMGMDLGMLGATGGKMRLPATKEQRGIKKQRKLEAVKGLGGSSGVTNGMASSLVFTPTQGLELHNPAAADERKRRVEEANRKWFDQASGFASARPR